MIIDGQKIALNKERLLKRRLAVLKTAKKRSPLLISLVAVEDLPGLLYTQLKQKAAARLGIEFTAFDYSLNKPKEVSFLIDRIVSRSQFDGLMIQKPGQGLIKKYFKDKRIFEIWWLTNTSKIPQKKDVDCLNVTNLGLLSADMVRYYPATVKAVYEIILSIFKPAQIKGKLVVIVGSSEILGKPLAMLLRNKGATVVITGSTTVDLGALTRKAEIIITGVGRPNLITAKMVTKRTVVIDAGIAKIGGKVVGDVDFDSVAPKASYITPVPGGVGPLTVISLMENLVKSFEIDEQ